MQNEKGNASDLEVFPLDLCYGFDRRRTSQKGLYIERKDVSIPNRDVIALCTVKRCNPARFIACINVSREGVFALAI